MLTLRPLTVIWPWQTIWRAAARVFAKPRGNTRLSRRDPRPWRVPAGTAAVVRNRGHVLDRADLQANGLERANRGFAAGAGTFDTDFNFLHAVRHRLAGGILRDLLRGVGRALA